MVKYTDIDDEENELYERFEDIPVDDDMVIDSVNKFEDFDNSVSDIDFSQLKGDFKSNLSKVNRSVDRNTFAKKKKKGKIKSVPVKHRADIKFRGKKTPTRVIVPRDRNVIVNGANKFILENCGDNESIRNIGYYKGKKLKKLILTFNNDSALDFNLEIFNPSMPLDYLYSTSLNLNDKIQVAGGAVSYTDVLHNILANPTMIPNATVVVSGPSVDAQLAQSWGFKNKAIDGDVKVHPINLSLQIDTMQKFKDTVYFDISKTLNRPFIPDGMDVITYKIYAGNTVTMCFYYKQISLKKAFFPEARNSKTLM